MTSKTVIGLMSGSSLDGIDLCCVHFYESEKQIKYRWVKGKTYPISPPLKKALQEANEEDTRLGSFLDQSFSQFALECLKTFLKELDVKVDLIASHGHTVKHEPENKITVQIGDGAYWAQQLNLPVVYDFRTEDVLLGGQGAPLVPIGDTTLFKEYEYCLNLGGISNLSYQQNKKVIACDISMCNTPLNELAQRLGKEYDKGGSIAQSGQFIPYLFDELNDLDYFKLPAPKSLDKAWYFGQMQPLFDIRAYSTEDLLNTCCEHIGYQIAQSINSSKSDSKPSEVLVTGGGAYNRFLLSRIEKYLDPSYKLVIPESYLIEYKEAIIFALMGWLRVHSKINVLSSVTGATKDTSSGKIAGI
jgi:anhydro-N-acetylmuramic acid kinase